MMMIMTVRAMMRVITERGSRREGKQLLTVQSEPSAKLSKADLMPTDETSAGGSELKALRCRLLRGKNGSENKGTKAQMKKKRED